MIEIKFIPGYKPNSTLKIRIHFYDKKTNLRKTYDTEISTDEEGYPNLYIWEDGNYSCDCNRSIFMYNLKVMILEFILVGIILLI